MNPGYEFRMRKIAWIAGLTWALALALVGAGLWVFETITWTGGAHYGLIYSVFGAALPGLLLYRWGRGLHQPPPHLRELLEKVYPHRTAHEMGHVVRMGSGDLQPSPASAVALVAIPQAQAITRLPFEKPAEPYHDFLAAKRMPMPRNVRLFAWLYLVSVAIGIAGGVLSWPAVWTAREVKIESEVVAAVLATFLVFTFPFFFLTVWARKNWARWVLLVEFVGLLPLEFMETGRGPAFPMLWETAQFVADAIEILAFYFLFTSNARPWFSKEALSRARA